MKQDKPSELDSSKLRRLGRLVFLARAVVLWERVWEQAWPLLILASLFSISILFDLLPLLPSSLHILVLGALGFSSLILFVRAFQSISPPSIRDGLHRLEKDSALQHQPLIALLDRPAGNPKDQTAQSLWIKHQDRMAAALQNISLHMPRSSLWKKDPYSLRAIFILLLVLGAIEARFNYGERIGRAFSPMLNNTSLQTWQIQAWITPPKHTGLSPIFLSAIADSPVVTEPIIVPQHSNFLVRLEGPPIRERVALKVGPFEENLENLGKGTFSLETTLDQGNTARLMREDEELVSWPLHIQADLAPDITIAGRPKGDFRGNFTLDYIALDDYGLDKVSLIIRSLKPDGLGDIILESTAQGREIKGSFRHNLAAHPRAGKEVVLSPKAVDNAGQSSYGLAIPFILPERQFKHPIATALINVRKSLFNSSPEDRIYAHLWVNRLLKKPKKFSHDLAIYFALRVAVDRLRNYMTPADVSSVQAIFWETAVRLDEGGAGSVRDQLEFMSRQMQDLMKQGEQTAAMEALFEAMTQSLDQFLQQMSKSIQATKGFEDALGSENVDQVNRDELIKMLALARDLMRNGNTEAAKALMDQFQSILSRIAMQKQPDPLEAKNAQEIMEKLRRIEQDQQKLLDQTFKRSRNNDRPSLDSTRQAINESEEQIRLKRELQAEMARLKKMNVKIPEELIAAEKAMKQSAQSLQTGLDESSVQAQTRVLDHLRKGLKDSATRLSQKLRMQPLPQQMPGYDPLGRGAPGRMENLSGQEIPTEAEIHRSRKILKELYRRAAQPERQDQELKYIERLLERF